MGGVFSRPKPPPRPAPAPVVNTAVEDENRRLKAEKAEKNKQMQSKLRARRAGGQRMLLSEERENPSLGIMGGTTLG
jgi:hypothetical protein